MANKGKQKRKVGLALGGGGARGLAHLGILKTFVREKIPIDIIVGTSIGALVGGAFASGASVEKLESLVYEFLETPLFQKSDIRALGSAYGAKPQQLSQRVQTFFKKNFLLAHILTKPGLIDDEDFSQLIDFFVPDIDLRDTIIPFAPVATDLKTGERVCLKNGSLRKAITASCAVPGVITPVEWGERSLSDGGIILLVPTECAYEMGADFVVSVSVDRDITSEKEFNSALDVYLRAGDIQGFYLTNALLRESDVVIRPEVGHIHWAEFSRAAEIIPRGEQAAERQLKEIREGLPKNKIPFTISAFLRPLLDHFTSAKNGDLEKREYRSVEPVEEG